MVLTCRTRSLRYRLPAEQKHFRREGHLELPLSKACVDWQWLPLDKHQEEVGRHTFPGVLQASIIPSTNLSHGNAPDCSKTIKRRRSVAAYRLLHGE